MEFGLSQEQERVKGIAKELALDFAKRAAQHDAERSLPLENFAQMRDAGFYGLVVPKELGGLGLGMLGWVAAAEEIAQGDAATALAFNMHINGTGGICQRPEIPDDKKQRAATTALEGHLMCTMVSEPTSSSLLPSTYNPTVEAEKVPGGYRLYGRKWFASNFEGSDYAYLYVHPKGNANPAQAMAVLIPTRQDGITVTDIWDTLGMRATRSNQVDFAGALVSDDFVLYETESFVGSFLIEESSFSFGGYTSCYMGLGLGMINWATKYLGERTAKGYAQPMGYHPDISHRIGTLATEIDAARYMVYKAAWHQDHYGPSLATFEQFLRAKLAVGNALQSLASGLAVACGLHSLFKGQPLERMIRDAATAPIMPPSADACASMIGLLAMGLDPGQAPSIRMA